MVIDWSLRAQQDLDALVAYTNKFSPKGAKRIAERLQKRALDLIQHPEQGPAARGGLRRLYVSRTPYLLIYRVEHGVVTIIAVLHGRRKRRS